MRWQTLNVMDNLEAVEGICPCSQASWLAVAACNAGLCSGRPIMLLFNITLPDMSDAQYLICIVPKAPQSMTQALMRDLGTHA